MRSRVVLADDDGLLLGLLERILEQDFDIVATATDGKALIDEVQRLSPDVAVTDISMPVLNGFDALRLLNGDGCLTKFVVCTANPDMTLAAEALRLGAAGYVLKQHACADLKIAIGAVLDGHTYLDPQIPDHVLENLMVGVAQDCAGD